MRHILYFMLDNIQMTIKDDSIHEVTFVTSFIKIYENDVHNKSVEWRIKKFCEIAELGIHICLYISKYFSHLFEDILNKYPNVKIMKYVDICDTYIYDVYKNSGIPYTMPDNRNGEKDNEEYMMLMHSKPEFLKDAIDRNIWNSTHFSWIDFNISHIFKHNHRETLNYIKFLSKQTFIDRFITIPGCTSKFNMNNIGHLLNNVQWRFCGGFIIGDKKSLLDFYDIYKEKLPIFLKLNQKIVWEVNFWSWLDANDYWNPIWFAADHNDSIVYIPADLYANCLKSSDSYEIKNYSYPTIDSPDVRYFPTSASYINYKEEHILNTRYVSYTLFPSGTYFFTVSFHDGVDNNKIYNKNVMSILNNDFEPIIFNEMDDNINLPKAKTYSEGFEDMRLYEFDGKLKFIATTVNYAQTEPGRSRMIIGNYNKDTHSYSEYKIIEPPYDTYNEKNWIPLCNKGEEWFIYKWSPFEIGKINDNNKLEIIKSVPIIGACFHKVRGSSIFYEVNDGYLGVIHFCEEGAPRHYYHYLVLLNKETMVPEKYSQPFYFNNISIEFCIGFSIKNEKYYFWISQMDGNPALISIDIDKVPLVNDVIINT